MIEEKIAKSLCNYADQHEKTTVRKEDAHHLMLLRLKLASRFFFCTERKYLKSVPSPHILAFIVQKTAQRCHFASTVSQFIIELYSPRERKVLNQHVPMTETELLIFPELFFGSSDKSHRGGLSFCPCYTILSQCVRESCAALCGT